MHTTTSVILSPWCSK